MLAQFVARLPPSAHNRRELDRIQAFSDGVFAIAITLLVLSIEVPEVDGESLGDALSTLGDDLRAYFIGFAVIGLFWFGHSAVFSYLRTSSGLLSVTNLAFLCMIALMPFTTALLGSYSDRPLAVAIYAANVGAAATLDSLIDQVALRGDLYERGSSPEQGTVTIEGLLRPAIFALSIPIAFVSIPLAELSWFLLLLVPNVARRICRRRSGAL